MAHCLDNSMFHDAQESGRLVANCTKTVRVLDRKQPDVLVQQCLVVLGVCDNGTSMTRVASTCLKNACLAGIIP